MKRKLVLSGYKDSSDDSDVDAAALEPVATKPKSIHSTLPHRRVTLTPAPGMGGFQLPQSARSSRTPSLSKLSISQSNSAKTTVKVEVEAPRAETNSNRIVSNQDSDSEIEILAPKHTVPANVAEGSRTGSETSTAHANGRPLAPIKPGRSRSTLSLERQLNELANTFDKYKESSDAQQQRTDDKLTRVLQAVNRLASMDMGTDGRPMSRSGSMAPGTPDARLYLANPLPTPELIDIVSRVVTESRGCERKKGGREENSLKEHARVTFYRMLNIQASKAVRPYFEDQYGEPDTLPEEFIDPSTNYCQPYPHWLLSLTRQVAWVPTYILRFRSTIPNDQSELSERLRQLSDEQIVTLLHDGPFKTGQAEWRKTTKTPEELEAMRSAARRYQRTERKAAVRHEHIKTIPSLQGPDWYYLYHAGYVSQDESDAEGELVTNQPDYRAQWETNLYNAIRVAEHEKSNARLGVSSALPTRRVTIIKRPIPQLERGSGAGKFIVRVAACGIRKGWKDEYPDEYRKYAHLINGKVVTRPKIIDFLVANPMPNNLQEHEEEDKYSIQAHANHDNTELDQVGEYDGAFGVQPQSDDVGGLGGYGTGDNQEEPAVYGPELTEVGETGTAALEHGNRADIPIDPELLALDSKNQTSETTTQSVQHSESTSTTHVSPQGTASALNSAVDSTPLLSTPQQQSHEGSSSEVAANGGRQVGKRTRSNGKVAAAKAIPRPDAPQPKKRGRPLGSKNKAKTS